MLSYLGTLNVVGGFVVTDRMLEMFRREKIEVRKSKFEEKPNPDNFMEKLKKRYDLLERTEKFSFCVRNLCQKLKRDIINREYIVQLIRSAGSVAGNYIEANENLGEGDLKFRIKICRKESKESRLWLRHVLTYDDTNLKKKNWN